MTVLPITLLTASVLAIIYVSLSTAVSLERSRSKMGIGTGESTAAVLGQEHKAPRLLIAVRRHANFSEYVPISLVLLSLLEMARIDHRALVGLAAALVLSRLMIAAGMGRAAPNVLRAGGNTVQLLMLVVASGFGLYVVAQI